MVENKDKSSLEAGLEVVKTRVERVEGDVKDLKERQTKVEENVTALLRSSDKAEVYVQEIHKQMDEIKTDIKVIAKKNEYDQEKHEKRWFDIILKVLSGVTYIAVLFLLYKLGIKS